MRSLTAERDRLTSRAIWLTEVRASRRSRARIWRSNLSTGFSGGNRFDRQNRHFDGKSRRPDKSRRLTMAASGKRRAYLMSRPNKELGLLQGVALLSTSLLGTGIFVVPALAATAAGDASLWAWLMLIALVLPVAFTFAQLGRRFPHAGGAPHLIGRAFGLRMESISALLFLAVLPVGLPAALHIASGFWLALFDLD